jgi:hypothetical protein
MSFALPRNHPCLNSDANVFELLGWFLAEFTTLENVLKIFLLRAVGAELQAGYFLVSRVDAKALAPKIRAALRQKHRLQDDLKTLLEEIGEVADVRNRLSHSALDFDDKYSEIRCIAFGATLSGGNVPSVTYSTNHLRHLAYYAMAATGDVLFATDCLLLGQTPSTAGLAKAVFPVKAPVAGQFDQGIPHTLAQKPVEEAQVRMEKKTCELAERQSQKAPQA